MACFCLLVRTHSNIFIDKLLFRPLTGQKFFFSSLLRVGNVQKNVNFFLQNRLNLSYFRSRCDKKNYLVAPMKLFFYFDPVLNFWTTYFLPLFFESLQTQNLYHNFQSLHIIYNFQNLILIFTFLCIMIYTS